MMDNPILCSRHKIKMNPSSGGSYGDFYTSYFNCPLCGERTMKEVDLRDGSEKVTIIVESKERIHYIKVEQGIVKLATCDDCRGRYYICVEEKRNGAKAPFCPGENKFIRSWDRVTWVEAPVGLTSKPLEIRGVIV